MWFFHVDMISNTNLIFWKGDMCFFKLHFFLEIQIQQPSGGGRNRLDGPRLGEASRLTSPKII